MDRAKLREIVALVEEMFKVNADVLEEMDVSLRYAGGRYSSAGGGVIKFDITEKNADGKEINLEAAAFCQECAMYGLTKEMLGASTEYRGRTWKIVGLKTRSRKYPFIMERDDGKRFKFPESTVKRMYGKG